MATNQVKPIVILVNNMSYLIDVVVIDCSDSTMYVYPVDANWNSETIEEHLIERGHKMSEADWAVIYNYPQVYHVTYNGGQDTWGYMTKEAFYRSLNETNKGVEPHDCLTEDKFEFNPIEIQYI